MSAPRTKAGEAEIARAARRLPYSPDAVARAVNQASLYGVSVEEAVLGLEMTAASGMPKVWLAHMERWRERWRRESFARLEALLPWYSRLWRRVRRSR